MVVYYILPLFVILFVGFIKINPDIGYWHKWKEQRVVNGVVRILSKIHFNTIQTGSYHPPPSGVLKLAHNLSLLHQCEESSVPSLMDTVCDMFLLIMCLCNQHCIRLQMPDLKEFEDDLDSRLSNLEHLQVVHGRIAHTINMYEYGREHEKPEYNLQYLFELFIWYLLRFLHERKIHDFPYHLYQKLHFWETANVNSNTITHDPTTSSSALAFKHIMKNSNCLFAATSKIWGSPEYDKNKTLEANVLATIPHYAKFLLVARYEHLDGFVITVPGEASGSTIEALGETVRRVLTCLADNDPTLPLRNCMAQDLERLNWQFKFCGDPAFITSFAPCYPATHPRYAFGSKNTFILFQPEFSFGFHDIPRDAEGNNVRVKTRRAFTKGGRPYLRPANRAYPVAPLYVKHMDNFDVNAVFKWWKTE